MRPRSTFRTGLVGIALAAGLLGVIVGSGAAAVIAVGASGTAGAATAKASPVPVLEQNLDGAGRIRVALPTNNAGQVQVSTGGPAPTTMNGPWNWAPSGTTETMASIPGPGVFTGLTMNIYGGQANYPDGSVVVYADGQQVFNAAQSWLAANWLTGEGNVMGGQWRPGWCGGGPCSTSFWWPPGGIAFQSSLVVQWANWTGGGEQTWAYVYSKSIVPVTSSPN